MSSSPSPLQPVLRMALPGCAVACAIAAGLVLAGVLPEGAASTVWIGTGVGCAVGIAACAVIEAASRYRPATPDGGLQAGMTVQVAAVATFFLKLVGASSLLLWGFFSDVKFPLLVVLGVAFAATAVCIQVLGTLVLARSMAARAAARRQGSGATTGS